MANSAMPLKIGTPEQFATLRKLFIDNEYTEAEICRRGRIESFAATASLKKGVVLSGDLSTPLDVIIHLFMEGDPVSLERLRAVVGQSAVDLFGDLGLVEEVDGQIRSTVGLYPCGPVYVASDRGGERQNWASDLVYPAILENTQQFLRVIPATPCEKLLDLGAGTGVAAFIGAATYARHAWAADIAERSSEFAEFGRRLNGLENATVVCGDLYGAVAGQTFDRIVTHPPYVPVPSATAIFRDGGEDGEQILRRAIAGLPGALAPGGQFFAQTLISDREGAPAETRVRSWLGDKEFEFDVLIIADTAREPSDFVGRAMQKGTHRSDELQYWSRIFRECKVTFLVYGTVIVQRHLEPRETFTDRVQKSPRTGPAEAAWLLDWRTAIAQPNATERLMQSRPRISPDLHLASMHTVQDGVLVPVEHLMRSNYPITSEAKCPAWMVYLVQQCDGRLTGTDLLARLAGEAIVDAETAPEEFAQVLGALGSAGFLVIELA